MSCKSFTCLFEIQVIFVYIDKTLNDMVPQLIPRDPVNSDGVKPGFNSIRSNIQLNETVNIDIDPTNNAPIAVFDGKEKQAYLLQSFSLF